jgi:hypothetical protein
MNEHQYTAEEKACQYNTLWGQPRAEDRQQCTNDDQPRGVIGTTPMTFGMPLLHNFSWLPALCFSKTIKNSTTVIIGAIDSFSLRRRLMR